MSTAYYALFHLLLHDAAKLAAPSQPPNLKLLVRRAFNHGEMRDACKTFVRRGFSPAMASILNLPLDPRLVQVLEAFALLQEKRHAADYDLLQKWTRLDALNQVRTTRLAFANWLTVRNTPNASVVMTALLLQKRWSR